ncbi:MAG: alginate export family protein [Deltaproteobacteria bacterium]|nr:alginate export family protein [Deltaproteobacteria bacterium]
MVAVLLVSLGASADDHPVPLSPSVEVWTDYVSGDSNTTDSSNGAFDTLFGTNHGYYGTMDIFTDIPKHAGGLGLVDMGVGVAVKPTTGVDVMVDAHYFQLAHADGSRERELGVEVDLTVAWIAKPFMLTGGYSFFRPGTAMTNLKAGGRGTERFAYVMTGVKF